MSEVCVWFNPTCSKCRGARDVLDERGVDAEYFHYLERAPSRPEIEQVISVLSIDDPRAMMRTGEDIYERLRLDRADRDRLIEAMVEHPILIERPIVIRGERAVIARPPEAAPRALLSARLLAPPPRPRRQFPGPAIPRSSWPVVPTNASWEEHR